jgi:hypothetical protein
VLHRNFAPIPCYQFHVIAHRQGLSLFQHAAHFIVRIHSGLFINNPEHILERLISGGLQLPPGQSGGNRVEKYDSSFAVRCNDGVADTSQGGRPALFTLQELGAQSFDVVSREQREEDRQPQAEADAACGHQPPALVCGSNALDTQSSFNVLKVRDLLAEGVHPLLPVKTLVDGAVSLSRPAKTYNRVGVSHPRRIAGTQVTQPLLLRRTVICQLIQGLVFGIESLRAFQIGMQERLIASRQIAAHTGFHIYQQLEQARGLVKNLIGVFHPLHGLVQVEGFPHQQRCKRRRDRHWNHDYATQ